MLLFAGCPSLSQLATSALNCAGAFFNATTCMYVATQCLFKGITNDVVLDVTTCPFPASGTTVALLPVLVSNGTQVGARDASKSLNL